MNARTNATILGIIATLALLSGCATTGAELTSDGQGSSSSQDDILQVMERDSRAG